MNQFKPKSFLNIKQVDFFDMKNTVVTCGQCGSDVPLSAGTCDHSGPTVIFVADCPSCHAVLFSTLSGYSIPSYSVPYRLSA